MNKTFSSLVAAVLLAIFTGTAAAQDTKPTRASQNVPELVLGNESGDDFAVSQTDFELIVGQGYRWQITSHGGKEYKFMAPDFFRNVWMNQIVIADLEVHMAGAPAHLEFDDEGTMQVQFHTVRPGEYNWWIEGLEERGMKGKIVIK